MSSKDEYSMCPDCACEGELDGGCEIQELNTPITYRELWVCDCGTTWWEEFIYTGQEKA